MLFFIHFLDNDDFNFKTFTVDLTLKVFFHAANSRIYRTQKIILSSKMTVPARTPTIN